MDAMRAHCRGLGIFTLLFCLAQTFVTISALALPQGQDEYCPSRVRQIGDTGKDFDTISPAYHFFVEHSTESVNLVPLIRAEVLRALKATEGEFKFLDFGAADSPIPEILLKGSVDLRNRTRFTLVEPAQSRFVGQMRLSKLCKIPPVAKPSLETEDGPFHFILANHVFYYVQPSGIDNLLMRLEPDGVLILSMADERTGTEAISAKVFKDHKMQRNQYAFTEVKNYLNEQAVPFDDRIVKSKVTFPDTSENRIQILRFIFGTNYPRFSEAELVRAIDTYSDGVTVVLPIIDHVLKIHRP